MASISWRIFIVPICAVNEELVRPARTMPVMMTPSSRSMAKPISSTTKISEPRSRRVVAPIKATTIPTKKERNAMIGIASRPASSSTETIEVQRNFQGVRTSRNVVTSVSPRKANVSLASPSMFMKPRPVRSSISTSPPCGGRLGSSTSVTACTWPIRFSALEWLPSIRAGASDNCRSVRSMTKAPAVSSLPSAAASNTSAPSWASKSRKPSSTA